MSSRNVGSSAVLLGVGQFATRLLSFLWIAYLSKRIGPSDFGIYNTVMSFVGLLLPASSFGASLAVMRRAARHPEEGPVLFGALFWIRLGLSVLLWSILMVVLPAFHYAQFVAILFLLAGLYLWISTNSQVAVAVYIAYQRTRFLWQTQFIGTLGWTLLGLVVLFSGKGLVWLFAAMVVNSVFVTLLHVRILKREDWWPTFHVPPKTIRSVFIEGAPMGGVGLLGAASERFDRILLSLFCATAIVGYYSLATMLVFTAIEVLWHPFTTVLYPIMSRAGAQQAVDLAWISRKATRWSILLAAPIVAGMWLVAPDVIYRIWGPAYAPTARLLQHLAWALPFIGWNRILGNMVIAMDEQKSFFRANLVAFGGAAIGNLLVLPRFGAEGAVWVMVGSQIALALFYAWITMRRVAHPWEPLRMGAAILAAILCFGPGLWTSHRWIALVIGMAVFGWITFHFLFDDDDRALLQRWMTNLRPARVAS